MRTLNRTDASDKSVTVDAEKKIVTCVHTVKPNADFQTRLELTWKLDFSKCTIEELIAASAKPCLIHFQGKWRAMSAKDRVDAAKVDNVTYDARLWIDNVKSKQTPAQKATKAVKAMNPDERAELIKELKAMEAAEKKAEKDADKDN